MPDPITPGHAARILARASAVDNREPSAAADEVWASALTLAGVEYRDCLAAVDTHFARSTARLMPAHVIEISREFATARREHENNRLALASVDTDRPGVVGEDGMPRIRAMLDAARARAAARANLAANPTSPEGPRD